MEKKFTKIEVLEAIKGLFVEGTETEVAEADIIAFCDKEIENLQKKAVKAKEANAKKKAEGMELDELAEWVTDNRLKVCHWFTVDRFEHLKHGGRVSAASATIGSALNIKPLLRVDEEGKLKVKEKPRGQKQAMNSLLDKMQSGWKKEMGQTVFIGHGHVPERAEELADKVLQLYPDAKIHIAEIGPVIGAHTGPGMLALVYWGNNR